MVEKDEESPVQAGKEEQAVESSFSEAHKPEAKQVDSSATSPADKQPNKKPFGTGKIIVLVAIVVASVLVYNGVSKFLHPVTTITDSKLEKTVEIEDLSTAEFTYRGIADKNKDDGTNEYHVAYSAQVKVGINMSDIKFNIDDAKKTVSPVLPKVSITSVAVDTNFDFIPDNVDANPDDVIALCKADVENEAQSNPKLYQTAEDNLKSTVEGLLLPVLKDAGYTISWDATSNQSASDASTEQSTTNQAATGNEG
ncbi:MAG: DUF4230 domain-containing protein [Atopobiaceae bacterium]|jgi:hypothetical protein|nr:DUF4230 domain-containing protein [Atopobiaceae bacterium]